MAEVGFLPLCVACIISNPYGIFTGLAVDRNREDSVVKLIEDRPQTEFK